MQRTIGRNVLFHIRNHAIVTQLQMSTQLSNVYIFSVTDLLLCPVLHTGYQNSSAWLHSAEGTSPDHPVPATPYISLNSTHSHPPASSPMPCMPPSSPCYILPKYWDSTSTTLVDKDKPLLRTNAY